MKNVRIIAVLVLLLSGSSIGFAFPSGINQVPLENENTSQLSEDFRDLSSSHLVTSADLFDKRVSLYSSPFAAEENSREISRSKGYFSISHLIEPGLGLADILFPFHTFL